MAIVGIRRFIVNNRTIQTKTATTEYLTSGRELTPELDDGSGKVMFFTQEKKAGSFKVQVNTLKSADTEYLKTLEDAEIVLELLDGKTIVGSNMTQTANNAVVAADGIIELTFEGDVAAR